MFEIYNIRVKLFVNCINPAVSRYYNSARLSLQTVLKPSHIAKFAEVKGELWDEDRLRTLLK